MIRKSTVSLLLAASFFISGCENTADPESVGASTGESDREIDSMSGAEDLAGYLEQSAWKSIDMDLEKFLYNREGSVEPYTIDMTFKAGQVDAIADCFEITARYRVSGDEISFSRVSSPKPTIGSCTPSLDADEVVSNFFLSSYSVKMSTTKSAVFTSFDTDAEVVLKR